MQMIAILGDIRPVDLQCARLPVSCIAGPAFDATLANAGWMGYPRRLHSHHAPLRVGRFHGKAQAG
jgi:hypothetical protein